MPQFDWQSVAALAVVAWAVAYIAVVVRRTIRKKQSSGSCGTCGSCPTAAAPKSKDFVAIDSLKRPT